MEWTDKSGKPLKKGDVVEWGAGRKGTVVELSSFGIRVQGHGIRGLEEWTGSSSQVRKVSNSCIVSTNPVVAIALNEKVRIGDSSLRGAATATLDFAKDRRGDYILADDEVIADTGDGIDTYEVLKVLPDNKVKIGSLGVEVATVDAKTVSVARKHGILKRDGETVVLKSAKFKVGDKVVSRIFGKHGRVVKVHGGGKIDVQFVNGDMGNMLQENVTEDFFSPDHSAVAANAGDKKCKVTLETVTFTQGVKQETRHMSIPELRTLMKMLGKGSDAESFIRRLETSGATDIAINDVDLYAALI